MWGHQVGNRSCRGWQTRHNPGIPMFQIHFCWGWEHCTRTCCQCVSARAPLSKGSSKRWYDASRSSHSSGMAVVVCRRHRSHNLELLQESIHATLQPHQYQPDYQTTKHWLVLRTIVDTHYARRWHGWYREHHTAHTFGRTTQMEHSRQKWSSTLWGGLIVACEAACSAVTRLVVPVQVLRVCDYKKESYHVLCQCERLSL